MSGGNQAMPRFAPQLEGIIEAKANNKELVIFGGS